MQVSLLTEEDRKLARSKRTLRLQPCALYAGLPGAYQLAALQPPARGKRKVFRDFVFWYIFIYTST